MNREYANYATEQAVALLKIDSPYNYDVVGKLIEAAKKRNYIVFGK